MKKNKKHLTREQRYTISRMLQAGFTKKAVCIATGKDKSVISRELKRNASKRGYSPGLAQMYCDERKERFRRKRKFTPEVERRITGWCRKNGIPTVSHERIYQYIRMDKQKGGTLWKHCRHRLKHRKRPVGGKKVIIPDKVMIDRRPEVITLKQRFGDWKLRSNRRSQTDTVVVPENRGAILTATERTTGFLLMRKLKEGKNAKALANELFYMFLPYRNFVHSITSDNGSEFYEHKYIAKKPGAEYFFTHPYSSWERGLNEYTNGLVRQYIPKKQPFDNYSDEDILLFRHKINRRPGKLLNFETPLCRVISNINKKVAFIT